MSESTALNWLTNYVRPRIRALVGTSKPEVPENLWHQCPACERMIFHRDLEANSRVCPHCGHDSEARPDLHAKHAMCSKCGKTFAIEGNAKR